MIKYIYLRKFEVIKDPEILSILEECKEISGIDAEIKVRKGGETPHLKGLLNPEIILPEGYTHDELKSVFIHELMHYKHKDILWNIIGTLLLCIYWYNPIIWLSYFIFRRDMEILCDYNVLQVYDNRKGYASVLLKTSLKKNKLIPAITSMQNGRKDISKRIKYIAYFKKPKVIWTGIGVVAALVIGAICLTNPIVKEAKIDHKVNGLDYGKIYEYKTLYVGDASKVGNLISNLYYREYRNGMSLQTVAKPYGITVNYLVKDGELAKKDEINPTYKMLKNAAMMFCLIDNVDEINFSFQDGELEKTFSFERQYFNEIFKKDIRKYSSSFALFKDEFIPMVEKTRKQ